MFWKKLLAGIFGWEISENSDISKSYEIRDIKALIRYCSECGINPTLKLDDCEIYLLSELHKLVQQVERGSTSESNQDDDLKNFELESTLIRYYSELNKYTTVTDSSFKNGFHVSGRTLIETGQSYRALFWLLVTTFILITAAVTNEILLSWVQDSVITDDGIDSTLFFVREHVLKSLMPFVWGGIGACMYLSMALYQIAKYRAFDRSRLHGWGLRVVLGSILAAVTVFIFNPDAFSSNELPIESKSVAFLVGLGVKVVFGAFEKLVNTLVEKFNLDALRTTPTLDANAQFQRKVAEYITELKDNDEGGKKALLGLLKKIKENP